MATGARCRPRVVGRGSSRCHQAPCASRRRCAARAATVTPRPPADAATVSVRRGAGSLSGMSTTAWIIIIAVVVVAILVVAAVAVRRRRETKLDLRRAEAREQRELAPVSDLEAQRQSAEAEERAARAKGEQLAPQQQQLAAARSRATVDDLRSRADEVDPDVESR